MRSIIFRILLTVLLGSPLSAQHLHPGRDIVPKQDTPPGGDTAAEPGIPPARMIPPEDDPCGFSLGKAADAKAWDYFLDTYAQDLQRWSAHPWVQADVIGESVERRPLYHLAITNPSSTVTKRRIWVHARTHPIESESSLVLRSLMDELLSDSPLARRVLDNCVVHVLPMLNPDGVALRRARENARGVDLESNWGAAVPEPEVRAMRDHLAGLMQLPQPIEVALNLHSAYVCKRYFVYHAAEGTSVLFTQLQQQYIGAVRGHFPGGIEDWDFFVSWTSGTPDRYPESWFWRNFAERVMALTYEDMNCAAAGEYDRTARALLAGSADYLGVGGPADVDTRPSVASDLAIASLYPHPVRAGGSAMIELRSTRLFSGTILTVHDLLGRELRRIWEGPLDPGTTTLRLDRSGLPSGTYLLRLRSGSTLLQRTVTFL